MRTLLSTIALALALSVGSIGTATTAEAGYFRYVYKPSHCFNVIKYTHWGPRLFYVCH